MEQPAFELPMELWSHVFSFLDTKEDRTSLAHTCKSIHDAPDIRKQLKAKLVVHFNGDATIAQLAHQLMSALTTHPPDIELRELILGCAYTRDLAGLFRAETLGVDCPFSVVKEGRVTFPSIEHLQILPLQDNHFESEAKQQVLGEVCRSHPNLTYFVFDDWVSDLRPLIEVPSLRCFVAGKGIFDEATDYLEPYIQHLTALPLESLVFPCLLHSFDQNGHDHPVSFPHLQRLELVHIDGNLLASFKQDIQAGMFPALCEVVVHGLHLFETPQMFPDIYENASGYLLINPDGNAEWHGYLDSLQQGGSLFLSEVPSFRLGGAFRLSFYPAGSSADYISDTHLDAEVYMPALERLMSGGMHHAASAVQELRLGLMFPSIPFLARCSSYFSSVECLVFDGMEVSKLSILGHCISAFPLLRTLVFELRTGSGTSSHPRNTIGSLRSMNGKQIHAMVDALMVLGRMKMMATAQGHFDIVFRCTDKDANLRQDILHAATMSAASFHESGCEDLCVRVCIE